MKKTPKTNQEPLGEKEKLQKKLDASEQRIQNRTNPKQTEEALKFSETRYRRLFETAQDGLLILDAET